MSNYSLREKQIGRVTSQANQTAEKTGEQLIAENGKTKLQHRFTK